MDLRDQLQQALGGAYRIERELGQGGMATVFLADDLKHDRKVAVKVLRPELAAALGAERFTREIRIAARLQHPHILPLLDSGEAVVGRTSKVVESTTTYDLRPATFLYYYYVMEIAFHGFRRGTRDILVMSPDGTNQRTALGTAAQERDPDWSPDGKRMSFSSNASGEYQVYTMPRQGDGWGPPTRLTSTGGIFPFWSPDGRYIAYSWTGGVELVSAGGGEPHLLPLTGPLAGQTPDFFAFTWAPDSHHIITVTSSDTPPYQTLWSISIEGGPPRELIRFDNPNTTFGRGTFVARAGTLYFTQIASESDVWTAEVVPVKP